MRWIKPALACGLLALATTAKAIGPDRLLLTTQEWFPYQTYANEKMGGIALNRVKCALRDMAQPYQLTLTDWTKAQLRVKAGEQHGFFIAERSDERDSFATMSEPLVSHHWYWYFADALTDVSLSNVNKLRWKVSARFGTNKWFYLHNQGYNVVKKPRDINALLRMLLQSQVDAILVDEVALQQALKNTGMAAHSFRKKQVTSKDMGVYFQNQFLSQYPGFLARFNHAVQGCKNISL